MSPASVLNVWPGMEDVLMVIRYSVLINLLLEEVLEKLQHFFSINVSQLTQVLSFYER